MYLDVTPSAQPSLVVLAVNSGLDAAHGAAHLIKKRWRLLPFAWVYVNLVGPGSTRTDLAELRLRARQSKVMCADEQRGLVLAGLEHVLGRLP